MESKTIIALSTLWLALAGPAVFAAEERPAAEFGDLVEVSEVLLDVLVTDGEGNVVLGLDRDDFIVEEAGEPVDLESVSFYSNRFELRETEGQEIQHPLPNEVPADRYFIFFFHDTKRLGVPDRRYVQQQFEAARSSQRWVREEMLPGDWVAVLSYDVKLKVHADFTHDRGLLDEAIMNAAKGKDPGNVWASRRPSDLPEGQPTLLANLPEGKKMRKETTKIYDGLELVAEATREIPGRKNLLLFSIGFGRFDGTSPFPEPDPLYYPSLERALNDNNVAIYTLDLTPKEFTHAQSNFLNGLALDTGGRHFEKFIGFLEPLRDIADEANGYYLLSYQAEHPSGESGYREVTVRTVNPDFKVRARQGYSFGTEGGS